MSRTAAITIVLIGAPQVAEGAPLRVSILSDGACPAATEVVRHLRRSLTDAAVLVHPAPATDVVEIADNGDHYTIKARDEERDIQDLLRDCDERARVAAVFAAMILDPPTIDTTDGQSDPASTPALKGRSLQTDTPAQQVGTKDAPAWLSLGLLTSWAGSSEQPFALGPEVAIGIAHGILRLQSSLAITTPIKLRFGEAKADVVRLPANVSAYVGTRRSDVDVAVGLGLAVEGLHIAGRGDFTPHTQSVLQLGLRAAARGRLLLDEGRSLFCDINGTFVPSTHDLAIEPDGVVGSTPPVWFGVTLGGTIGL